MPAVDLLFPARGGPVPLDHGYLLFSALAARIPELHERPDIGIFNLRGEGATSDVLRLGSGTLRIRCPAETIPLLLGLAGGRLELAGRSVSLGAPSVRAMEQTPRLSARLVTFKHALEESSFREAAQRFITELTGASFPFRVGRRRIVTIAGKKVVGFGLDLSELTPDASLMLQEKGLGGRRHMGCGLFLPTPAHRVEEPRHASPTR